MKFPLLCLIQRPFSRCVIPDLLDKFIQIQGKVDLGRMVLKGHPEVYEIGILHSILYTVLRDRFLEPRQNHFTPLI